jgi:hypothetical protein
MQALGWLPRFGGGLDLVGSMFAVSANFDGASRGQVPSSNAPSKEILGHHSSGAQQVGTASRR